MLKGAEGALSEIAKAIVAKLEELRVYLAGKVAIPARGDKELREELNALTSPPYVPVTELSKDLGGFEVVVKRESGAFRVCALDLKTLDEAVRLANAISARFEEHMPFAIERVDVVASIRGCEDGGVFHSYSVEVCVNDPKRGKDLASEISSFLKQLSTT